MFVECKECGLSMQSRGIGRHIKIRHDMKFVDYVVKHEHNGIHPVCACGCGNFAKMSTIKVFGKYLLGHGSAIRGIKHTEERKIEQSRKMKLYYIDPRNRYKAGNGARGKSPTKEHREALRASNLERLSDPIEYEKQKNRSLKAFHSSLKIRHTDKFRHACRDGQKRRFSNIEERIKFSKLTSGSNNPRWNPNRKEQAAREIFGFSVRSSLKKAKKGIFSGFLDYVWPELGFSSRELKEHIEKKFISDMDWNNWGKVWHIDHIIPVVRWEVTTSVAKVNALSNLRPLSASENLSKSARLDCEWKNSEIRKESLFS